MAMEMLMSFLARFAISYSPGMRTMAEIFQSITPRKEKQLPCVWQIWTATAIWMFWASSVFAVWCEIGGAGLFFAGPILSTELGTAVGDMDGDGDLDVAYDTLDDGYVWRENLGDDAPFGSPQPITAPAMVRQPRSST